MPLKPCRIAGEAEVSPGWEEGFGCGCTDTQLFFCWCHGQGKAQGPKSLAKLAAVREDAQGGTMRVSNCREVTSFGNITPDEHSCAV